MEELEAEVAHLTTVLEEERDAHRELRSSSQTVITSLLTRLADTTAAGGGGGGGGGGGEEEESDDAATLAEVLVERAYLKDEVVRLRAAVLAAAADAAALTGQLEARIVTLAQEKQVLAETSAKAMAAFRTRVAELETELQAPPEEAALLGQAVDRIQGLEAELGETRAHNQDLLLQLHNTRADLEEEVLRREQLEFTHVTPPS